MSSNKSFIFPSNHNYDNEETPLKQPYHDFFTSKQKTLKIIKWAHIKCGFLDAGHLFILPINCLNHHEVLDVNVEIAQNLYNAYCTLFCFWIVGIPKSTVLKIIFRVLTWLLSLKNAGPISIIYFCIIY